MSVVLATLPITKLLKNFFNSACKVSDFAYLVFTRKYLKVTSINDATIMSYVIKIPSKDFSVYDIKKPSLANFRIEKLNSKIQLFPNIEGAVINFEIDDDNKCTISVDHPKISIESKKVDLSVETFDLDKDDKERARVLVQYAKKRQDIFIVRTSITPEKLNSIISDIIAIDPVVEFKVDLKTNVFSINATETGLPDAEEEMPDFQFDIPECRVKIRENVDLERKNCIVSYYNCDDLKIFSNVFSSAEMLSLFFGDIKHLYIKEEIGIAESSLGEKFERMEIEFFFAARSLDSSVGEDEDEFEETVKDLEKKFEVYVEVKKD